MRLPVDAPAALPLDYSEPAFDSGAFDGLDSQRFDGVYAVAVEWAGRLGLGVVSA